MDKQISILLVDDEEDFPQTFSYWLKRQGYAVSVAHNGLEALEKIKKDSPDIVFLDLVMPNMDGYEVLKLIREFNQELPVIVMSAYVEDSRLQKKIDFYGASGIFYKGDEFQEASTLIKSALKTEES